MVAGAAVAQAQTNHPGPLPLPGDLSVELSPDGKTTIFTTGTAFYDEVNPFAERPPSNVLPTVYENATDSGGDIIPNTLPSTPENPYNLHPDPVVTDINPRSPEEDLRRIIQHLNEVAYSEARQATDQEFFANGKGVPADARRGGIERTGSDAGTIEEDGASQIDYDKVQMAIDILEGNPVANRAYSGLPLLHYKGSEFVKTVDPETKNVTVHQIWTRENIESDAMFIDPSAVPNEEWTITYVIDVLRRGHEDFAPFMLLFDDPNDLDGAALPHVAMDQTFFPMEEGKRYTFKMKMPPARYWNLTYHWGWRVHSPRIQSVENATKVVAGKNIVEWETDVFGENPSSTEEKKLKAISMIGDLSPAKRMWKAFREIEDIAPAKPHSYLRTLVDELQASFEDWKHRNKLPRGVEPSPDHHQTLFYVNNTIYGTINDQDANAQPIFHQWETRGATMTSKLYNGDYFPHAYFSVDFGGLRGYENIFQNTLPIGGAGPWFTFGRAHWFINTAAPALVPAAERPDTYEEGSYYEVAALPEEASEVAQGVRPNWLEHPGNNGYWTEPTAEGIGEHNIAINFRYEPSIRLRYYQFDPLHHNVAIWSVH
ncbi:hypothetical protein [Ferruginivarius sediminum]|uniref:Uncharacterized protein n=1 Tax=Ferruginivarius sediminum TaxID=2661937 RepID=A0A369TJI0_9PROT|nr:hypothetical protein [Ferruginivarius sediminum]RDD63056.1 hypothetical protein DRB17_04600 [Ferruginivarius sediminum]